MYVPFYVCVCIDWFCGCGLSPAGTQIRHLSITGPSLYHWSLKMFDGFKLCGHWQLRYDQEWGVSRRSFEILHFAYGRIWLSWRWLCSWQEVKIQLLTASFDSSMDMFAKVLFASNLSSSGCRHLCLLFANEDWAERLARGVNMTHGFFSRPYVLNHLTFYNQIWHGGAVSYTKNGLSSRSQ